MELITLEEFKDHSRILYDDEDTEIQTKVDAANAYVSGFIDTSAEDYLPPADIKQAALMIAAHWFENRENTFPGSIIDIPLNAADIIANYREWSF
ncbi:head-tail connector protein [Rhizobium leucaenae]|uniref:head-tail connector protein n=1 Tax=Rhizobium leucaenae TaxID=29450 RepID=UPI0016108DBB|nr:head-tail connector protein [Rhizobium leucaenae]MBB6299413.1 hypothetical protein [Rhizobium leucaenae]